MDIGIIRAGRVAQAFARHALHVGHTIKISNSRGPSTLGDTVHTLGSGVTAVTTAEAAASELVVLAVPWDDVVGTLTHLPPWQQQILIDTTNPFHGRAGTFTLAEVHGLSTSQFVAQLAPGAKVVKAINHMLVAPISRPVARSTARNASPLSLQTTPTPRPPLAPCYAPL